MFDLGHLSVTFPSQPQRQQAALRDSVVPGPVQVATGSVAIRFVSVPKRNDKLIRRRGLLPLVVALLLALLLVGTSRPPGDRAIKVALPEAGSLPLYFERNDGQADTSVRYLAHGPGYNLFLAQDQATLVLQPAKAGRQQRQIALRYVGANPSPKIAGQDKLPGVINYYLGHDPQDWRTNIPTYAGVLYQELYPGIDLLFYGNEQRFEHDFILAPGVDPDQITIEVQGSDPLVIGKHGDLRLSIGADTFILARPRIYQLKEGVKKQVEGSYVLQEEDRFGFHLAAYDRDYPLVIDPIMEWSTYFGGADNDYGNDIAVDTAGNIYITGATNSVDLPVLNAAQPGFGGGGINCPSDTTPYRACYDAFVSKLNPAGSELIYSTYIGLPGDDEGHGVAVDAAGNAYVTGLLSSNSESLPDMFIYKQVLVVKLSPNGSMVYGG